MHSHLHIERPIDRLLVHLGQHFLVSRDRHIRMACGERGNGCIILILCFQQKKCTKNPAFLDEESFAALDDGRLLLDEELRLARFASTSLSSVSRSA